MKSLLFLIAFLSSAHFLNAQKLSALVEQEKNYTKEDTVKCQMQLAIANQFSSKKPDSGLIYVSRAIDLARKLNKPELLGDAYSSQSFCLYHKANFMGAIQSLQQSIKYYTQVNIQWKIAYIHLSMADDYRQLSLYPQAIDHILKSIKYFEQIRFPYGTAFAVQNLGLIYMSNGSYDKALAQYQKQRQVIEAAKDKNTKGLLSTNYLNLGDAYMHLEKHDSAIYYNKKALALFEIENNLPYATNALFNLAFSNRDIGNNLQALHYFDQVINMDRKVGDLGGVAPALDNKGDLFLQFNNAELEKLNLTQAQQYQQAIDFYNQATAIYKKVSAPGLIRNYYTIADFYDKVPNSLLPYLKLTNETRDSNQIENIQKGVKLAKKLNLLDLQTKGYRRLSEAYEKQKNYDGALIGYKDFILVRDSISNAESQKKITQREMQYEFDKKEGELILQQQLANSKLQRQQLLNKQQDQQLQLANQQKDIQHLAFLKTQAELNNEQLQGREKEKQLTIAKQNQQLQQSKLTIQKNEIDAGRLQRNLFIAGCIALLLITFFILRNYFNQRRANKKLIALNKEVNTEKEKSDELLLNILPEETAAELKLNGFSEARRFDHVTVLFTDIVNFTGISERLTPQELVNELNYCFKSFDEIITQNHLEKIKTIGDAYLAVCGLPAANEDHAKNVVSAAIGIRDFMAGYKAQRLAEKKLFFELRMGINSGVVVAGIVGIKKYAYDIWGDAVNTAARMEQNGEPGRINISNRTYELVKDHFPCTFRGKIDAKNKGEIEMYFID